MDQRRRAQGEAGAAGAAEVPLRQAVQLVV